MRIALIISGLSSGGAERVLSTLANHWHFCGHDVHLITLENNNADFYEINPRIHRHALGIAGESRSLWHGVWANFSRIRVIRNLCLKIEPEVVLSFLDTTNILASIALYKSGIPLVASERTDPTQWNIGRIRKLIRPFLYRYACKAIVVQTDAVLEKLGSIWRGTNLIRIPNPLPSLPLIRKNEKISQNVLSVGRLDLGKGLDVLINAFASVVKDFPEWTLRIVGEGPLYENLTSQISELKLTKKVVLCGSSSRVFEEYNNAEIFCLTSRCEGFPNALLEALAMGCACISTDCESGPREILKDGRLGILTPVDDVDAMADALRRLINSPELREQYGSHSAYVRERYRLDKISQQWLDLFEAAQK